MPLAQTFPGGRVRTSSRRRFDDTTRFSSIVCRCHALPAIDLLKALRDFLHELCLRSLNVSKSHVIPHISSLSLLYKSRRLVNGIKSVMSF